MNKLYYLSVSLVINILLTNAQIPVSEEPMHHNVFQNDYVRVLDVHVNPKDTTLFHKHELPSVFIVLSNARTGSELISDGEISNAPVTYGNIWFDGFYTKPRIHRVWNVDTIEFHVMDIELLQKNYTQADPPLQQATIHMLFDEKPVRSYLCTLETHSKIEIGRRKKPMLVVSLSDSLYNVTLNNKRFQKKGDFIFIPGGNTSVFTNDGDAASKLVIFELK